MNREVSKFSVSLTKGAVYMCRLSIAIDQSIHTVAPIFEAVERSSFYVRSIRVIPVAWSRKADIHLSLGGGSQHDLRALLYHLHELPAVISTHHVMPHVRHDHVAKSPKTTRFDASLIASQRH